MKITVYVDDQRDVGRVPGLVAAYQKHGHMDETRPRMRDCVIYTHASDLAASALVWGTPDHLRVDLRSRQKGGAA